MSLTFFISCKKGSEDPFLSFKSRESRLCKTWKLSSGIDTAKNIQGRSYKYDYNNDYISMVINLGGTLIYSNRKFEYIIKFEKGGDYFFDFFEDDTLYSTTYRTIESGKWSFVNKGNGLKNKESIYLIRNRIESFRNQVKIDSSYIDENKYGVIWNINGLHDHKLHMHTVFRYHTGYFYQEKNYYFSAL